MRFVELIKNFGKFRRKKSNSSDGSDEANEVVQCDDPHTPSTSAKVGDSAHAPSTSHYIEVISSVAPPTYDHMSTVSLQCVSDESTTVVSAPVSFSIRNRTLLLAWRRVKRVKGIGVLCALGSVVFWSSNGLFIKLNQSNHHIHTLETLTVSSAVVSLVYLLFIFGFYGKRTCAPSTTSVSASSASVAVISSNAASTTTLVTDLGSPTLAHQNDVDKTSLDKYDSAQSLSDRDVSQFTCDLNIILGVPGERISLLLRCLLGTISLACFYSSYRYIPLGDATTIRFTSPVFIAIFAHFLVNEPFGLLQVVNSCTTLAGVILIGRPSFLFAGSDTSATNGSVVTTAMPILLRAPPLLHNASSTSLDSDTSSRGHEPISSSLFHIYSNHFVSTNGTSLDDPATAAGYDQFKDTLVGVGLALVASVTISISMIFMRKMKKTPAPLVIFWFSLSNVVLGMIGLAALKEFRMPQGIEPWIYFALTTICSGLDQLFITLALKLENAGAVAVIQALCVVLSFVFSILILHEPLYWTSALGGSFIFLSVIVLGLAKMLEELGFFTIFGKKKKKDNKRKFNLMQNFSSSSLSNKSKSFDILDHHHKHHQQSNYGKESGSTVTSHTSSESSSPTRGSFLYEPSVNEPYLLRMAPISTDIHHINRNTTTHTSVDDNNNDRF